MGAVVVQRLTPKRWPDVRTLFGDNGAYANCWCMWWRETSATFDAGVRDKGAGNRAAFESLVSDGRVPGLLAYRDRVPVGWVSLAPREEFGRLQRSPKLKPVDDVAVWAITCFFVAKGHRRGGVGRALLDAAVSEAERRGAAAVEGYPSLTWNGTAAAYTGTPAMFESAGFVEIARRGGRPIMRRTFSP